MEGMSASSSHPVLWILARGSLGSLALGPMVRYLEMAKAARQAGFVVHLCLDECQVELPEGIRYLKLGPDTVSAISEHDPVVASIFLDPRTFKKLLDSNLDFDVDFYCVGVLEGIESDNRLSRWRLFQGRQRTLARYRAFLRHARRIFISTPEQAMFLGGLLFSGSDTASCRLASTLPERLLMIPMGVRESAPPMQTANPYPPELADRPIFLWGGGIWAWFDIDTLLQAFSLLKARQSNAALFFLCGSNLSGLSSQDEAVRHAVSLARELDLVGKNVFFLDGGASSNALPGYLEHCTAGIMANPARMESIGSWRTRLLDLIWARKAVVTCGYDPLSERMSRRNVGIVTPTGDVAALAQAIEQFQNPVDASGFATLQAELAWSRTFAEWSADLSMPRTPRLSRPGIGFWIRYLLGV